MMNVVVAQSIDDMFRLKNGNEWAVEVAEWGYILSATKERPKETGKELEKDEAVKISNEFLQANAQYFGIKELNYTDAVIIKDHQGRKSWVIVYEGQRIEGLPVTDTHTTVIMTMDGQIYAIGNLRYSFEEEILTESVSKEDAVENAKEALNTILEPKEVKKQILPKKENETLKPEVIWNVSFSCPINKDVFVGKEGEILKVENNNYACNHHFYWIYLMPLTVVILILMKKMSKKGVAFGLILIIASLSLLSILMLQKEFYRKNIKKSYLENRIDDMNNLIESVKIDIQKAVDTTTRRAIAVLISDTITTGNFTSDAASSIKELVLFGTMNGLTKDIIENSTLKNWSEKMLHVGEEKGYKINISFVELKIKPYDSFNILVESVVWVNVSDETIMTSIKRRMNVSTLVSIQNFEDPIYVINTNSKITKIIKKTKFENNYTRLLLKCDGYGGWKYGKIFFSNDANEINSLENKSRKILMTDNINIVDPDVINQFLAVIAKNDSPYVIIDKVVNCTSLDSIDSEINVLVDAENGAVWYIDNLIEHYLMGYYSPSLIGPSFLDRIEGKLYLQEKYKCEKICGLESFVNKEELEMVEIEVKDATNIDYLYFNNTYVPSKKIKGMPKNFLLDNTSAAMHGHLEYYGVSELID